MKLYPLTAFNHSTDRSLNLNKVSPATWCSELTIFAIFCTPPSTLVGAIIVCKVAGGGFKLGIDWLT